MKKLLFIAIAAFGMFACTEGEQNVPDSGQVDGALPGKFSVSASTKVQFSQGNLQYQASTGTWRFAEHQWDTIGATNINVSESYSGWIDLFHGGTGNTPILLSQNPADYATFVDWGINPISNGGNKANEWRTLSFDEWSYLFHDRSNAETLFAFGNVAGKDGIILLPDSWSLPSGVEFFSVKEKGLVYTYDTNLRIGYYENDQNDNYSHNHYTREQWKTLEHAGAVFLPVTGQRFISGDAVFFNDEDVFSGYLGMAGYWTAVDYKDYGTTIVPFVDFSSRYIYLCNGTYPYYRGCSVRLVKDVE